MDQLKYFVSGGCGGIFAVLVGHPLDTVKVRLQAGATDSSGKPLYAGTMDCILKTVQKEGPLGLYKGMSAPLVAIAPIFAVSFFGYGLGRGIFGPKDPSMQLSLSQCFCAGALSGLLTSSIMAPGERIKVLLQLQDDPSKPKLYSGTFDCAMKLFKEGGIKSIYRGFLATVLRDVPAAGLYFSTYEFFQNMFTDNGKKESSKASTLFSGGMAGVANWIIGMPADVLKSRLQGAPEGTYPGGMKDVFVELMKTDGPLGLYKGITPVILRAFPANAASFLGFDMCMKFLSKF
ncbi:congested-like trachea protein [Agrilus planipennis]|uniref:Congested-like trachea protein n=1 Tax=Agrilus planipennis TaxID=224129 RepID=A0A1W4X8E6_AGRPL|nr:congested-like trachea protein [Agrilus planipennis]